MLLLMMKVVLVVVFVVRLMVVLMMRMMVVLIGMEMEMQDGDLILEYCQLAMFAPVFWSWWWSQWWWWYKENEISGPLRVSTLDLTRGGRSYFYKKEKYIWWQSTQIWRRRRWLLWLWLWSFSKREAPLLLMMMTEIAFGIKIHWEFWVLPVCCVCTAHKARPTFLMMVIMLMN